MWIIHTGLVHIIYSVTIVFDKYSLDIRIVVGGGGGERDGEGKGLKKVGKA